MRLLLVEDNYFHADLIRQGLIEELPRLEVTIISSEQEFRMRLAELAVSPPDVILMDISLTWTHDRRDRSPAPEDVRLGGFYKAGFRCQQLLERGEKTRSIPLILLSVIDLAEFEREFQSLPANVRAMQKQTDQKALAALIGKMVGL